MTAIDYAKAFGVALLLMVLNVAVSFVVMAVYGYLIDPGHDASYYESAAQRIAPWSSVFAGALLFFAAAWLFGMRKPARPAFTFALIFTAIYTLIDLSIIAAVGALASMGYIVAISIAAKFAAAFLGASMARRRSA
jgi:hypothetical protein